MSIRVEKSRFNGMEVLVFVETEKQKLRVSFYGGNAADAAHAYVAWIGGVQQFAPGAPPQAEAGVCEWALKLAEAYAAHERASEETERALATLRAATEALNDAENARAEWESQQVERARAMLGVQ